MPRSWHVGWGGYKKLVDVVADAARSIVRENAIPASVQWRHKEGFKSPQDVENELLVGFDETPEARGRSLLERLKTFLDEQQDDVVRRDPNSCDPLLMILLDARAEAVLQRHPAGRGRGRPPRIASAARRYNEWRATQ